MMIRNYMPQAKGGPKLAEEKKQDRDYFFCILFLNILTSGEGGGWAAMEGRKQLPRERRGTGIELLHHQGGKERKPSLIILFRL